MIMFNSLSYATKLVDAGVPREQAEVHAQVLQGVYEQEHEQYATKADFIVMRNEVTAHIDKLEDNTARLDKITDEIAGLKVTIDECKNEFAGFKSDLSVFKSDLSGFKSDLSSIKSDILILKNSHKYLLWIGGVMAATCLSMFGINISMMLAR